MGRGVTCKFQQPASANNPKDCYRKLVLRSQVASKILSTKTGRGCRGAKRAILWTGRPHMSITQGAVSLNSFVLLWGATFSDKRNLGDKIWFPSKVLGCLASSLSFPTSRLWSKVALKQPQDRLQWPWLHRLQATNLALDATIWRKSAFKWTWSTWKSCRATWVKSQRPGEGFGCMASLPGGEARGSPGLRGLRWLWRFDPDRCPEALSVRI